MSDIKPSSSSLFTVRVWTETLGEGVFETRFWTKHVLSGESRIFREGEQLLQYLLAKSAEKRKT